MALEKMTKGCPYGGDVKAAVKGNGDATTALAARVVTLESSVTALETKLAAVLAAKDTDEGKTLQIDDAGKVKLVTVV